MGHRPKEMPCPVCKENVQVKRTHRGKPYWQCDECGVQVFVRRQEGIERLEEPNSMISRSALVPDTMMLAKEPTEIGRRPA